MVRKEKGGTFVVAVLTLGIAGSVLALVGHQVAEAKGWQFCNWVITGVQALLCVYIPALATCLAWLLENLSRLPVKVSVPYVKIFFITMGVMVFMTLMPTKFGLNFFKYAFTRREERNIEIDGTAYVARVEMTGLDRTGISYHVKINPFLYEKAGWVEPYDHDVWEQTHE